MKVVGKDSKVVRRVTCRSCSSIVEFVPCEMERRTVRDYTGDSDVQCFIKCPECKSEIFVREYER